MKLDALPGSVPVGRLFGIPVRLHMLQLIATCCCFGENTVLFLATLGIQLLGSIYYGGWAVLLWFLLLGPVLLLTVLIHELGHCLAARSVGGSVHGILLWPLGGLAFIGHTAGPRADMWVAVAGPLTHIPMVGFWVGMLALATHANTGSWRMSLDLPYPEGMALWQALCAGAVILNISLFAFNLLVPAYPLDGGRLLVDLLLTLGVEDVLAAKITLGVAVPIGIGIIVFGCVVFQMVTILVGLFILWACYALYRHVRDGTLNQHPLFAFSENSAAEEHAYWTKMSGGPQQHSSSSFSQV